MKRKILNLSTPKQIRTATSFIRQSLELREGDSSVIKLEAHMSLYRSPDITKSS